MTPAEVASLERQSRQTGVEHWWQLVGEGLVVDLAAVGTPGYGVHVQWMGVHANRPFSLEGEDAELHHPCAALGVDGWCVVDASRGDRLVKAWERDRDDAPIWAALEALAAEVAR